MTEWYYARGGQQTGPVSFEQLTEIARSGGLDPLKDLVWTSTMKDWVPAGQVSGIFNTPVQAPVSATDPSNPYSAPNSGWNEVARTTAGEALEEIIPGSEPIDVGGCVKRGFDLTIRHFGMILLVGIVYLGVSIGAGILLGLMDAALGWGGQQTSSYSSEFSSGWSSHSSVTQNGSPLNMIVTNVLSIFLSLGVTRIGLNIVSGKEISVGMLFEGGKKLLPAIGASILYALMVGIGLLLLIVPGIYLAMRYGQYMTAIVDRNLGVMESFEYSSSITTNNRMNLFLLALLGILIMIAGCLALCVGIFFAIPVIWLGWIVAYRWMQYGHRAALDHHGTTTPMLSKL
jgi:hypothetical protein